MLWGILTRYALRMTRENTGYSFDFKYNARLPSLTRHPEPQVCPYYPRADLRREDPLLQTEIILIYAICYITKRPFLFETVVWVFDLSATSFYS